ncbi:hypothetical protein [Mycoplasmopsis citelli]|nr:hypothetical protein [Mycoplasmopsis citelli]
MKKKNSKALISLIDQLSINKKQKKDLSFFNIAKIGKQNLQEFNELSARITNSALELIIKLKNQLLTICDWQKQKYIENINYLINFDNSKLGPSVNWQIFALLEKNSSPNFVSELVLLLQEDKNTIKSYIDEYLKPNKSFSWVKSSLELKEHLIQLINNSKELSNSKSSLKTNELLNTIIEDRYYGFRNLQKLNLLETCWVVSLILSQIFNTFIKTQNSL